MHGAGAAVVRGVAGGGLVQERGLDGLSWQGGYGGFTGSASDLEQVRADVLGQEEHHRGVTFQEEYVAMLQRGLVEYEEGYLW